MNGITLDGDWVANFARKKKGKRIKQSFSQLFGRLRQRKVEWITAKLELRIVLKKVIKWGVHTYLPVSTWRCGGDSFDLHHSAPQVGHKYKSLTSDQIRKPPRGPRLQQCEQIPAGMRLVEVSIKWATEVAPLQVAGGTNLRLRCAGSASVEFLICRWPACCMGQFEDIVFYKMGGNMVIPILEFFSIFFIKKSMKIVKFYLSLSYRYCIWFYFKAMVFPAVIELSRSFFNKKKY